MAAGPKDLATSTAASSAWSRLALSAGSTFAVFVSGRREARPPWITLFIALTVTLLGWASERHDWANEAEQKFTHRARSITHKVEVVMQSYAQVLRGGLGLFHASDHVSRQEWQRYVEQLSIRKTFPGIQGIGFAESFSPADREAHMQRVRGDGLPDYAVRPSGDRPLLTAITYLEPYDRRNARALGFDMFSEPGRRAAMESARDTGEPALSRAVTLVQEIDPSDVQPGVLLYLPFYDRSRQLATVDDRRSALKGFVYAPFRMHDLVTEVLRDEFLGGEERIDLAIVDLEETNASTMLFGTLREKAAAIASTETLDVFGRRWELRFSSIPGFEAANASKTPAFVLLAGLIVTFLLTALAASLAARHVEAAEVGDRLDIALAAGKLGAWHRDLNTGVLTTSAQTKAHFGRAKTEMLTSDDVFAAIHAEDLARVQAAIRAAISSEFEYEMDYRVNRPDGSIHWVRARGRVRRDRENKPTEIIGLTRDITETKAAESTRNLLLGEVNHRAKNMLAVVQGIARQTLLTSTSPEAFGAAFETRLQSLSRSLELLTATQWQPLSITEVVTDQLSDVFAPYRDRMICDLPLTVLGPQTAITLGLVIHELMTNSIKHGSLSAPDGRVCLAGQMDATSDPPWLHLAWEEKGGRPVQAPTHSGFGSFLLERGVKLGLGGRSERTFLPTGLICRLGFPLYETGGATQARSTG